MKRTLISISVGFAVAVLIWLAIFLFNPTMNYEKAFVLIFYSSLGAGTITAFVWRARGRRRQSQ